MQLIVLTLLKVSQGVAVKEPQFGHGRGKDESKPKYGYKLAKKYLRG